MLQYLLSAAVACATPLALAQSAASPAPSIPAATFPAGTVTAGKVELVEGDVRIFDGNLRLRRPKPGDPVYKGDSIFTGGDGELHLSMEDGGYIGVRPNTTMRIVNYKAAGGSDDLSVISLAEGSFRSVTGWIAKLRGRNYFVRTPTAAIGARGTEHEPLVILEGSKEGEPGTYDRVYVGETVIETRQGSVKVRPDQAGFVPHRGAVPPRVLDRIPGFFRETRNEHRFEGLHERIQKQLEKRRAERRKRSEQRREQSRQLTEDQKQLLEDREKRARKSE